MEKLVRDKIISKGETPDFRQTEGSEKLNFLFRKLVEEALELQEAGSKEELADVEEVIFALYTHLGWTREEIEAVRLEKLKKNGGFEKGYILNMQL